MKIVIINYGMGNLHSVYKKVVQAGITPMVAKSPSDIQQADKIILPGVGHFGKAMDQLKAIGMLDALNETVLVKKKPVLGICLGMQLMAAESEEGHVKGLGWFDARVVKFKVRDKIKYKIPQTGWNTIHVQKQSRLLKDIDDESEFYFLHAFHYEVNNRADILTTTTYEYEFVSAVEKENIFGTQFHPEKSHDTGTTLLKNFIQL